MQSNILAGRPAQQINNYDVLLLSSTFDEPVRFSPGNHIGNQRFKVTLSLFRERYIQADLFGDESECVIVALDVMDTVCMKCVPNGRFFEQGRTNRWEQLDQGIAIAIIRDALKNEPMEGTSFARAPKKVCRRPEAITSRGFDLLFQAALNKLPVPEEFVSSPKPFDIVCDSNGRDVSRSRQHIGNNRLKVMIDIRSKKYETSNSEGKKQIANEVVSSILDDAQGRFLKVDKISGMYKLMSSRELAAACIKTTLDSATAGEDKKQFGNSEVRKLQQRKLKKALLDRHEARKGRAKGSHRFSTFPMPTTFKKFAMVPYSVTSKAA